MSSVIEPRRLIELIHGLDTDHEHPNDYISVTRWSNESGSDDADLETLVRTLARERLGGFPLDELGAATLAEIDARGRA